MNTPAQSPLRDAMNRDWMRRWRHLLAGAGLGIAAFTLVLIATDPPGPGLDPDALSYLGAAESLAWQGTWRAPAAPWWSADSSVALAHFPPGYPTVLALPVRLGMPSIQAARLVDALAAGLTVAIAVLLVAESAGVIAGGLAGAALMATPALARVHLSVLSEPLFLACTALLLALMTRRRARPVATGLVAAVSALVRYAGAAYVGAAVLWAVAPRGSARERLRRGGLALLPSLALQGAWLVRTRLLHERGEIRHVAFYGGLGPMLAQGATTVRDWLIPDPLAWTDPLPWRPALALAALVVVVVIGIAGVRRAMDAPRSGALRPRRLFAASALLVACYLGMLLLSRLLADPHVPLDERLLSPAILLASIVWITAMALWWCGRVRVVTRIAVALVLATWGLAGAESVLAEAAYAMSWGSDFAGEQWRRSETVAWAREKGMGHRLYSNWPPALWFQLHRATWYVPGAGQAASLPAFADSVRAHDGRVLVFTTTDVDYLGPDAFTHVPGLRVLDTLEDGIVLAPSPRARPM